MLLANTQLEMSFEPQVVSVSEITQNIKWLLENHFTAVWVEGEISNFKHHSSGHIYFSLKDPRSQLRCVMWKWQNRVLRFVPEDGMRVVVQGRISIYEAGGQYQLVASQIQPVGVGALQLAFEQLKRRLAEEGLFDPARKKPLPSFPDRIGVVTSPTGAAIRDIIKVLSRRCPGVQIVLRPVRVQGTEAAAEVARAIHEFNDYNQVDVLIVGRGGGAVEDLWAFNEEEVARAIFASKIPVVSAVGHEIDYTIADLVADVRAPTPSAAAERVVQDQLALQSKVQSLMERLRLAMTGRLQSYRQRLRAAQTHYGLRQPVDRIAEYAQRLDDAHRRLTRANQQHLQNKRQAFQNLAGRLQALSPLAVLERGYAVCQKEATGEVVKSIQQLRVGEQVKLRLQQGQALCRVDELQA